MDALRFKSNLRYRRIALAAVTLIPALPLSLVVVALLTTKGLINGLLSVGWHTHKLFEVNWKD